jgi:hypothetical protein
MEITILRYIDILIGLAVVMLLGTTVVAAVTQLVLSSFYFRARTLRLGIQELIRQLDPSQLSTAEARLVAERLLRHPLLARPSNPIGVGLNRLHNLIRRLFGLPPLLAANPTDVIQRSELVLLLMEWAANQGPLALASSLPPDKAEALRDKLLKLLNNNGIDNPADILRAVRRRAIENEKTDPAQPAHLWWNSALLQAAASDFLGKINQGFDNAMTRVSQAFGLKAKAVACVVSLVVVFSIQLDSLALLKRLSVDDKLRDSLVREAEMMTARVEKAEAKAATETPAGEKERARQEAERARAAREEIDSTLALMREPRLSLIPDTLHWQKLAQGRACPDTSQTGQSDWKGALQVASQTYGLAARQPLTVETLEAAIAAVKAPVYLYRVEDGDRKCLLIVARSPAVSPASLKLDPPEGSAVRLEDVKLDQDREGAGRRLPGVLLSWVLLSLGTPFWFNLLKNLLGLRSALARKDDKERSDRESLLTPPKT